MRALLPFLTLAPAALFAQAPAQAPAAPSFSDQFKAQAQGIQELTKTDPSAALAKAESLIPTQPLAFDNKNISATQKSINEFESLTKLYALAAQAANSCGQWEKAQEYAGKAKATAQSNYENAQAPLAAFQDTWKKAGIEAQKNLDETATLEKLEKPTADQINRMIGLQKNKQVYLDNISHGKSAIAAVDANLQAMKAAPADYDPFISNIAERLKNEAANIDKFKGDKKAFAAAALKGADAYNDKDSELAYVRRLQVLAPDNKAIAHKIDVLLGKAKDEPVKPAKRAVRSKKGH